MDEGSRGQREALIDMDWSGLFRLPGKYVILKFKHNLLLVVENYHSSYNLVQYWLPGVQSHHLLVICGSHSRVSWNISIPSESWGWSQSCTNLIVFPFHPKMGSGTTIRHTGRLDKPKSTNSLPLYNIISWLCLMQIRHIKVQHVGQFPLKWESALMNSHLSSFNSTLSNWLDILDNFCLIARCPDCPLDVLT